MSANPIKASSTFYPGAVDPLLEAIRKSIVDAPHTEEIGEKFPGIDEFGEDQVVIIAPDETDEGIEGAINSAIAITGGLCLLMIAGSGKNPDAAAPGPRVELALELQLFVSTQIRVKDARSPMALMGVLCKFLHHAQIRITGFPWFEEIRFDSFDSLPDPDYTAYSIQFTRDTTF